MEEEKKIYKHGRYRPFIGRLQEFEDLSPDVMEKFRLIKSEVHKLMGEDIQVTVFGSWLWGYADKDSDYDVLIDKPLNEQGISKTITEILGFQSHVTWVKEKNVQHKLILIA